MKNLYIESIPLKLVDRLFLGAEFSHFAPGSTLQYLAGTDGADSSLMLASITQADGIVNGISSMRPVDRKHTTVGFLIYCNAVLGQCFCFSVCSSRVLDSQFPDEEGVLLDPNANLGCAYD